MEDHGKVIREACPARKALQRMMDEHGHDCDCIPRVLCEYCEGRAALSAPCPCEHFVWSDDPAIDRRVIARLRSERDSLRAELAAEKERSANLEMARDIAQERADRIEAASWNALKLAQSLHDLSLKSGADLAASQERERLLREALSWIRENAARAISAPPMLRAIVQKADDALATTEGTK